MVMNTELYQKIQAEEKRNIQVYMQSAAYAREHGELDAYRASNKANVECRYSIEAAIKDHYRDNHLDVSCAKDVGSGTNGRANNHTGYRDDCYHQDDERSRTGCIYYCTQNGVDGCVRKDVVFTGNG